MSIIIDLSEDNICFAADICSRPELKLAVFDVIFIEWINTQL